jgi:NAD(P)-dependent dehydrogenase (short-subunit alcohol dehydrogenase family)
MPHMPTRTAIITGASRGLGRALAHHLAGDGWGLVIDARDRADLANAAADIQFLMHLERPA